MPADSSSDTELARRATGGDGEAFGLLFDRWLDRAFDVAWHVLHNRETAADATQEAFAAAWLQIGNLRQPDSFGGWLLRITRNKALNQLQKQRRSSPIGSEETLAMMDPREADDPSQPLDQQELGDLVWAASAALGEEDASLLNLHLRNSLEAPELAAELGVKANAAHQRLFRLKKRLAEAIGAWVLWRQGRPSCPELTAALERAEVRSFDGATAKAIRTHARSCESCDSSRKLQLSPEALFSAIPLVAAGPVLRAKLAAALEGQGVPVHAAGEGTSEGPSADNQPDEPGEPDGSDGADGAEGTAETSGTHEPTEADENAEPSEADGTEGAELDDPVEGLDDDGGSRRRRTAAKVGAVAAVVLLGGVGALAVLADRAGDRTGDQLVETASDNVATGTDIGDERSATSTRNEADKATGTDAPATTAGSTSPADDGGGASGSTGDDPPDEAVPVVTTPPGDTPSSGTTGSSGTTTGSVGDPAPVIVRFTATPTDRPCGSTVGGTIEVTFSWESSDATSATIGPDGSQAEPVAPAGSVTQCAQPGSTWVLTATGPGGTVSEQANVPAGRPGDGSGPGDLTNP